MTITRARILNLFSIIVCAFICSSCDYDTPDLSVPSTPSLVAASDGDFATGVLVSWGKVPETRNYLVYRSTTPGGSTQRIGVTRETFYRDSSVAEGVPYYYSIIAENKYGPSKRSTADEGYRAAVAGPITWTIMIYMDADNDLDSYGLNDFAELEAGFARAVDSGNSDLDAKVNVIVLFDRWEFQDITDWDDTRLFRIGEITERLNGSGHFDEGLSDTGTTELDMADPDTLSDFISFCKNEYPAQYYALVLWNHGEGVRASGGTSATSSVKSVCTDDSSNDSLYIDEIQQALSTGFSVSDKLDIIGFDACLMGMAEVAYEFRDLASYFIASMTFEQRNGWDYETILSQIQGDLDESLLTPPDMSYLIVDSYYT